MSRAARAVVAATALQCALGGVAPPLPRLHIVGKITVSGVSSGADAAPMMAVAYSDKVGGTGSFAGQAYGCATMRFPGEPTMTCASQNPSTRGPGCVGLESTGPAPCIGCPSNETVTYDHCKALPEYIDVARLQTWARGLEAQGDIAPLSGLARLRVYTYRGTGDSIYLPGSVNATGAFFAPFLEDPAEQVLFEASIPSNHSQPSIDPHIPPASCGRFTIGSVQNCGYDGVGAMLRHFFPQRNLITPPANSTSDPARLIAFGQDAYGDASEQYGGLGTTGYVYVPTACVGGATPCSLHVALHGCNSYVLDPGVGFNYTLYGGYGPWADANDVVVLYPQGGGFVERGWTCDANQVMAGCYDGYGQTGPAFADRRAPQLAAIAAMARAIGGPAWWDALQ